MKDSGAVFAFNESTSLQAMRARTGPSEKFTCKKVGKRRFNLSITHKSVGSGGDKP
jgi:hypothetical protein